MSKPLNQFQLARLQERALRARWLDALRAQGERKCIGNNFIVRRDGREVVQGCALTLLGETVYGPLWWEQEQTCRISLSYLGALVGLNGEQIHEIIDQERW